MIKARNSNKIKRTISKQTNRSDVQKRIIRTILLIGAIFLVIIFFLGDHGLYQLYTLKKERAQIQNQINILFQNLNNVTKMHLCLIMK